MGAFDVILRPVHPRLAEFGTFRQFVFITGGISLGIITIGGLAGNINLLLDRTGTSRSAPVATQVSQETSDPTSRAEARRQLLERRPGESEEDRLFREQTQLRREIQLAQGSIRDVDLRRNVLQAKIDMLRLRIENKKLKEDAG